LVDIGAEASGKKDTGGKTNLSLLTHHQVTTRAR